MQSEQDFLEQIDDGAREREPERRELSAASRALAEVKATMRDLAQFSMLAIIIVTFVAQPVKVEGSSMLPKLHDGERIIINKFLYTLDGWPSPDLSVGRSVRRGDIVVFYYPNDPSKRYVKRVIGVPGDLVRIDDDGRVFINGDQVEEPYLSDEYTRLPDPMPTTRVAEHHYFVMGDNRDNSSDSRAWGLVPERYICGEAVFRFWPLDEVGTIE